MDIHTKFDLGDYARVKDGDSWETVRIVAISIYKREGVVSTKSLGGVDIDDLYYVCEFCRTLKSPVGYSTYEPTFMERDLYTSEEAEEEVERNKSKAFAEVYDHNDPYITTVDKALTVNI